MKIQLLFFLVIFYFSIGFSQTLNLPARKNSALSGSQFEATIKSSSLSLTSRENMIFSQVEAGNVPNFYRTMKAVTSSAVINSQTQSVTYYVIPDYLAIGCDTDYFLCPMSPMLVTKIGNLTSTTLPTRKMVNDIWQAATVHLTPQPLPPVAQMTTVPYFAHHDSLVDSLRQTFVPLHPLGELTGGDKKDVIISNLIYNTANRVVIYGWHQTNGSPIQPMANVHADTYMDYSHGIRLVQNSCVLNGNTATTVQAILQSASLNPILSDEGVMSQPWYPYGTILNAPQSFALKNNSSSSLKLILKNDSSATHYTVYKSTDGITYSSPVLRKKNDPIISGLTGNQLYFVKISSYDSVHSYASGISEVLAAIPSAQNDSVLLVNGFDRVITGNTYDFVRQHGNSFFNNNKKVESCTNEAVTDSLVHLSDYRAVDWILGEESSATETFSNAEQSFVSSYLQAGGYFFTSGSEIGWDLDHLGAASDKQFYNNFLKASYVADAPNNTAGSCYNNVMQPLSNSIFPFSDTVKFDDGTHGTYNVNYPDVIASLNGSISDLRYTTSAGDIACVHFAGMFTGGTHTGKLVYLAYPFETIYNSPQRDTVMKYILKFFFGSTQATGMNDSELGEFLIYPNPSSGEIHIAFEKVTEKDILVELLDLSGRSLMKKFFPPSQTLSLDVRECSNGTYLLKINHNESVVSRLILISK